VSKNAVVGLQKLKQFYEKSLEKYETLSKDINHRPPQELFISDQEFIFDYKKFKTIDFSSVGLEDIKAAEVKIDQTAQPSFHKNFELLIEDLEERQSEGFETWISFSTEKQKERLESIFEELEHEVPFKSFKSELHEGFVDSDHKLLVY